MVPLISRLCKVLQCSKALSEGRNVRYFKVPYYLKVPYLTVAAVLAEVPPNASL